jgi:hypothetical protein
MRSRPFVWIVSPLVFALLPALVGAQQEQPAMSPEAAAAQEAWMKAATPGPQHKVLEQFAGEWTYVSKAWMAPGAPAQESTGTSTNVMLYGGRYLRQVVDGEMMGEGFHGMGLVGYDNVKGKYVSAWIDNMGTSVMPGEGTWDEASKTLTVFDAYLDPVTGKPKTMRMVTRIEAPNRHVSEFFDTTPDGSEAKIMEITYTRK